MMTTTQQDKPGGKPRQRNRKSESRKQKGEHRNGAARDPQKAEKIQPVAASSADSTLETSTSTAAAATETAATAAPAMVDTEAAAVGATATEVEMIPAAAAETATAEVEVMVPSAQAPLVGEVLPPVAAATAKAETADNVTLLTIANALADYARTSLQESGAFMEKFMRVRSFDKAIELQGEFARQACTNFVAESQKICGLYGRWVRQIFTPWEVAAAKLTQAGRQSW